jgi:hypothetical protein
MTPLDDSPRRLSPGGGVRKASTLSVQNSAARFPTIGGRNTYAWRKIRGSLSTHSVA